jgi:hypothetical protein
LTLECKGKSLNGPVRAVQDANGPKSPDYKEIKGKRQRAREGEREREVERKIERYR